MNLEKIRAKLKAASLKLADYGIPTPILRDPFTKRASLPFSMMVISIVLVVIGIVGKLSDLVGGIDKGTAMQFLTTSAALYFGHSWVHNETKDGLGRTESSDIKTGEQGDNGKDPS
jgi:uncharacterized membrane protein